MYRGGSKPLTNDFCRLLEQYLFATETLTWALQDEFGTEERKSVRLDARQ